MKKEWETVWHLEPGLSGYKHIILEPSPGGGLAFARGIYTSTYGKISVEWKETERGYEYEFEIPANTSAFLQGAVLNLINGQKQTESASALGERGEKKNMNCYQELIVFPRSSKW